MAILHQDFENAPYAEVATLNTVDSAHDKPSSVIQGALAIVNRGDETALALGKLIDQRGRQSENAAACRTLVSDYLIGLNDLRTVLSLAENGDQEAVQRIPGIVASIQESFDFDTILSKIKAYSNKKDGTRALPAYVQEVCTRLSGSFYHVFNSVSPLSEVLGVQMRVRDSVSAVGNYKFHGTKAPVAKAEVARPAPVVEPAKAEVLDFTPAEKAWFASKAPEDYAEHAVKEVRGGFFSRIMGTLGGLASSVSRKVLPRAAMAGLALSLGGCVPPPENTGTAIQFIAPKPSRPLPALIEPVMPAAPQFQVDEDAPNLWEAISHELADECGLSGKQLQRETGKLVRKSFETHNAGYLTLAQEMSAKKQADAKAHLSSRYGLSFADTTEGIFKSTVQTGNLGAVNMQNGALGEITLWGTAAFDGYTCPTK